MKKKTKSSFEIIAKTLQYILGIVALALFIAIMLVHIYMLGACTF